MFKAKIIIFHKHLSLLALPVSVNRTSASLQMPKEETASHSSLFYWHHLLHPHIPSTWRGGPSPGSLFFSLLSLSSLMQSSVFSPGCNIPGSIPASPNAFFTLPSKTLLKNINTVTSISWLRNCKRLPTVLKITSKLLSRVYKIFCDLASSCSFTTVMVSGTLQRIFLPFGIASFLG